MVAAEPETQDAVIQLFDGKSLAGWKVAEYGGGGEVHVDDGRIILETGVDLTGVTLGPEKFKLLPKINYEVSLEAMRVNGNDFFCGLTFPVGDKPCSLIVGGWGGGVVGLSSLDGLDASENETTSYRSFKSGQWHRIRVRVTKDKIEAWIDKDQVVDVETTDRKISIRSEVEASQPLGIASWRTTAALRDIKVRKL
jgi:hypothetical protein